MTRARPTWPARPDIAWLAFHIAEKSVWGLAVLAAGFLWLAHGLPEERSLAGPSETARVRLLDIRGRTITERGLTYVGDVPIERLPPHVPLAVVATEDRRFHRHAGIDPQGLLRAVWANVRSGRVVQGGSTITQQLAKTLFLSPERSLWRKVQEALLALWLEGRLSKEEILELYLNRVYFGAGTHGIDAASRRYFGKPASRLEIGEAAMLAGLLKAPSRYAPTHNHAGATERANLVLAAMEEEGYITPLQREMSEARPIRIRRAATPGVHYFVDWIINRLPDYAAPAGEDLIIETTLDIDMQGAAEDAVALTLASANEQDAVSQAALVALGQDGAVRAMVGGRSYRESQFNRATLARRQPGSAFKPVVFLAALEQGMTPATVIRDEPLTRGRWQPRNYKDRYEGEVRLSTAMALSLNAAAIRVGEAVGSGRIISTARRLGLDGDWRSVPSLPLGTVETTLMSLTSSYVPVANGGLAMPVNPVIRIRTTDGRTLYEREATDLGRVMSAKARDGLDYMLRATVAWGTGKGAQIEGFEARGKTGTSQGNRDAWFVGYAGGVVAGVWMGNDDNTPMGDVTGGSLPARLWGAFMSRISGTLSRSGAPRDDSVPEFSLELATVPTRIRRDSGEGSPRLP